MKILYVGSEVMPYAATGGLGDVLGSLPAALASRGKDEVGVVMPLHPAVGEEWRKLFRREASFVPDLGDGGQECAVYSFDRGEVRYYFIENEKYFTRDGIYGAPDDGARYAFFCAAVIGMLGRVGFIPDILHANDWHSALCLLYLKTEYREREEYQKIKSVYTIHNLEYQGEFAPADLAPFIPPGIDAPIAGDKLNLMKAGIERADRITTVSPSYAVEIQTPGLGHGLEELLIRNSHKLSGILNGIDYDYYNPVTDPELAANYSSGSLEGKFRCRAALQRELGLPVRGDIPLIAIISRLAPHKGIDLIREALPPMLAGGEMQLVVLGRGEKEYEDFFRGLEREMPDRARALIEYDRALARRIYAGADIFLMPSRREPCGLSQMIASRYGAIPVVREVGGLRDSIKNYRGPAGSERLGEPGRGGEKKSRRTPPSGLAALLIRRSASSKSEEMPGNGFTFADYTPASLAASINEALSLFSRREERMRFIGKIMEIDFSWRSSAEKYRELYCDLLQNKEDKV